MNLFARTRCPARLSLPVFSACLLGLLPAAASGDRPNLLFIFTDDQSHRTLGCYRDQGAYEWARTPHLDALARRGVRFTHAYPGTWCVPSRFTALTGRHSYNLESVRPGWIYPRNHYDPAQVVFWPRVFREHGYHTGMIGKWHTGVDAGFGRDWDYQRVWNRPLEGFIGSGAYYRDQDIHFDGARQPVRVRGYPADHYTDWAVEYIRDRAGGERPWALWLCFGNTHPPFTAAPRHAGLYPDLEVPEPPGIFPPRSGKPAYVQALDIWAPGEDGEPRMAKVRTPTATGRSLLGETLSDWVRQYQQCTAAVDEGVGRVLAALQETGQVERTLVVFTSDQGFALGQHGFAHKLAPYDANLRAPLIVSRPGTVPQNRVCGHPVGGVDLVATFYAQAGIAPPTPLDGHDLTPLLRHPERRDWDHPVIQSYTRFVFGERTRDVPERAPWLGPPFPWWVSVVDDRMKYVRTMVTGEVEELYDLAADPDERSNLALRADQADELARMREVLDRELARTGAPFRGHLPPTGTEAAVMAGGLAPADGKEDIPRRRWRWVKRVRRDLVGPS
jgi:arylsulfatase A-like enzyme